MILVLLALVAYATAEQSVGGLAFWQEKCAEPQRQNNKKACLHLARAGCTWKGGKCRVQQRMYFFSYVTGEDISADLYDCQKGKIARGSGPVYRVSLEECKKQFKATMETFVYFAGSQHCQAAWERYPKTSSNSDWQICTYPDGAAEDQSLAMVTEKPSPKNIVIHGFAVVGLGFLLYGAGQHFMKGSHAYSSVEPTV